jgi:hypothetical protein
MKKCGYRCVDKGQMKKKQSFSFSVSPLPALAVRAPNGRMTEQRE